MIIGTILMWVGGTAIAVAVGLVYLIYCQKRDEDESPSDDPEQMQFLERLTFDRLAGWHARFGWLAVPLFVVGVVLTCLGIVMKYK